MEVIHLTDYQGRFGSKYDDVPYRSGFDLALLRNEYAKYDIDPAFVPLSEVKNNNDRFKDKYVLYTSAEDPGYHYKKFVEDVVFALELSGARVLPAFKFLHATNNKVFMEKLRELYFPEQVEMLATLSFGSADELTKEKIDALKFPVIVKTAEGASGSGVFLAHNKRELVRLAKRLSRTKDFGQELWDIGRSWKHKGYRRESLYRNRFIVQKFIPGLKNDWKIYVFGSRYYIFFRPILKHREFKASGGGYHNYSYGENANLPPGIFNFAKEIYDKLNVPQLSIDVAYDCRQFHLLEFQSVYFGTAGIVKSNCYYTCNDKGDWRPQFNKLSIENVYAGSIKEHILKNKGHDLA